MDLNTVLKWLEDLCYAGQLKEHIVFVRQDANELSFKFYTEENEFKITAKMPDPDREGHEGYLGCTVTKRKAQPGEDWNRGNDLHDGNLSRMTWDAILADIVSYEMVPLNIRDSKPIPETTQT